MVDHCGYLWMSSTLGVIRYNGYNLKIFNSSDGLPREDVWQLFEDRKGRIWLGAIAEELGYIYGDSYHSLKFGKSNNTIYPSGFNNCGDGVALFTAYVNNTWLPALYLADSTTTEIRLADSSIFRLSNYNRNDTLGMILEGHPTWAAFSGFEHDTLGYFIINNHLCNFLVRNKTALPLNSIKIKSPDFSPVYRMCRRYSYDNYILFFSNGKENNFVYLNRHTGDTGSICIKTAGITENIEYMHRVPNNPRVYAITKNYLITYTITDSIRLQSIRLISSLFAENQIEPGKLVSILNDPLWGNVYTTKTNGAFVVPELNNKFRRSSANLKGFQYINTTASGAAYWWNEISQTLAESYPGKAIKYNHVKVPTIHDVIEYAADTLLLCGIPNHYYVKSKQIIIELDREKLRALQHGFLLDNHELITISNYGLVRYNYSAKTWKSINNNRFLKLAKDRLHNEYWAYNNSTIVIYNSETGKTTEWDAEKLRAARLNAPETILIDPVYGNIIIKDITGIHLLDKQTFKTTILKGLDNVNIKNCQIVLSQQQLLITGKIGVIKLDITGRNSFSEPRLYPNAGLYTFIYNIQPTGNNLLLGTDKGLWELNIKDSTYLLADLASRYKFICKYRNDAFPVTTNDTLQIDQEDLKLQFDIVNPNGNGPIRFTTWLNSGKTNLLTSNELTLPLLEADNYYTLKIVANDDIWRSKEHTIIVYIKPKWYQTRNMRKVIAGGIILSILSIIGISALVTRKMVLNATRKRNLRMELELKSIYAQINPHFIFNSLNSALLLVSKNQTEDAYMHISKFSRLLRSYIKSSRNKLILLSEEIRNLSNYIDLQQVRFKNKFEYKIDVAPEVDPDTIYLPSLLLQPFVENAIEHGLLDKPDTGHLLIAFKKERDKLVCIIDDDGIGREQAKANKVPNPVKDESYGELLIKDLVNIFNKYEHMNIRVSYEDKEAPLSGTIVSIFINLNS